MSRPPKRKGSVGDATANRASSGPSNISRSPGGGEQAEPGLSRRSFVRSAGVVIAGGMVGMKLGGFTAGARRESQQLNASVPAVPRATVGPVTPMGVGAPPFSIFWITDTQFLSEKNPALYRMMTNWIVRHWNQYNAKLVIHTGDMVQTGSDSTEWGNADEAMSILTRNQIPYIWCAGNHDDMVLGDPTFGWIGNSFKSFDPSVVSQKINDLGYISWAGDYHQGMNTAVSFRAGGKNFLVIGIEWNAQPDVLEWVGSLLADPKYSEHHIIMAPHAYINSSGSLNDPTWGAELADFTAGLTTLMNLNSRRVFLTLNGHFPTDCGFNTREMVNNRNELLFDRQDSTDQPGEATGRGADNSESIDADRVGGSTITVLTFSSQQNAIHVRTFDIYKGEWRVGQTEQYTLDMFPTSSATLP